MSKVIVVITLLTCVCVAGCAPYSGLIYTDVKTPGATQLTGAGYYPAMSATGVYELDQGKGPGSKAGEVSVLNILGLVAIGDASVEGAAKDGQISTIHTIDQKTLSVLSVGFFGFPGIFSVHTTRVTGE